LCFTVISWSETLSLLVKDECISDGPI
jgi:hypothetical protein